MATGRSICVFCGSSPGSRPEYAEAARQVGSAIASRGLGLVYGGGRVGLMGTVADSALAGGGRVLGVIPEAMAGREVAHDGLTELVIVRDMHARKALMAERSEAFLVLPGGIGTYEEFFEILTWSALGYHAKPVGVLDVAGYFGPLRALIDQCQTEGFLRREHLGGLRWGDDADGLIGALMGGPAPAENPRWIGPGES